nr:hypothetical protein [Tanacetum cinerariifolium]
MHPTKIMTLDTVGCYFFVLNADALNVMINLARHGYVKNLLHQKIKGRCDYASRFKPNDFNNEVNSCLFTVDASFEVPADSWMECNKDEATRVKEIAESKFSLKDLNGAKKFGLKAQNMFPCLEDDDTLKKHYRKLALSLHPDKNGNEETTNYISKVYCLCGCRDLI